MSAITMPVATEYSHCAIPIKVCLDSLFDEEGHPLVEIDILERILTNIINDPQNTKLQSLNASKLLPRLTSHNLAPWYILRHAGFIKSGDRLVIFDKVDINKVISVYNDLKKSIDRAAEKVQVVQDKYNQELALADARLAERIAKRHQESEEAKKTQELSQPQSISKIGSQTPSHLETKATLTPSSTLNTSETMSETKAQNNKAEAMEDEELEEPATHVSEEEQRKRDQEMSDEAFARELQAQLDHEAALDQEEKNSQSRKSLDANVEEEVDPELAAIVNAAKQRNQTLGKSKKDPNEKPLAEMTREEKLEWLAKKRAENRKRSEQKKIDEEKEKYQNKKNLVHAQMDVQERLETIRMKEAAAAKAKENKEKAVRMARLREREAQEKARRKADAEKRAAEIERIRQEKAAAAKK